jgi:hypothetical protein
LLLLTPVSFKLSIKKMNEILEKKQTHMNPLLKSFSQLLAITLCTLPFANAQEVRVIDNKGTMSNIRNNNNVYTSATDPNTPPNKIV